MLAETVLVTSLTVDRQQLSAAPSARSWSANLAFAPRASRPTRSSSASTTSSTTPFEPVPVADGRSPRSSTSFFVEHRDAFPARRSATRTADAALPERDARPPHVLGYIGKINEEELAARPGEGYQTDDMIGKTGIEQMYESELRGTPGVDKVEVDNEGRAIDVVDVQEPVAGHDVQLSLDLDAQRIAEESLAAGHGRRAQRSSTPTTGTTTTANGGAVVVLDARTGSVVALASHPTFDPNDFITGDSDKYFDDPTLAR